MLAGGTSCADASPVHNISAVGALSSSVRQSRHPAAKATDRPSWTARCASAMLPRARARATSEVVATDRKTNAYWLESAKAVAGPSAASSRVEPRPTTDVSMMLRIGPAVHTAMPATIK